MSFDWCLDLNGSWHAARRGAFRLMPGFECSMRRFAKFRLRLCKTFSAGKERLDMNQAVSTAFGSAFGSAREAILIFILYICIYTDVSREIQFDLYLQVLYLHCRWSCFWNVWFSSQKIFFYKNDTFIFLWRNNIEYFSLQKWHIDALCMIYLDSKMDALGVLMVHVPLINYLLSISPMEDWTTRIQLSMNIFQSKWKIWCWFIRTFRVIYQGDNLRTPSE